MNTHVQLAIHAISASKGDDLYRAKCAFRGFTPQRMKEPYAHSGKTPEQIIAEYEAHEARVNAAIAYLTLIALCQLREGQKGLEALP
jgi:hypothetical protein